MRRVALVTVVVALAAACGSERAEVRSGDGSPVRYEVSTTVLESPDHGPQLCLGGVADSFPPQCGGPDVVGWDWADVEGEESANGTTWGEYGMVGTWDGRRFTLTETPGPPEPPTDEGDLDFSPACDDPAAVDPGAPEGDFVLDQTTVPGLVMLWVSHDPFVVNVIVRPGLAGQAEALVRETWAGRLCVVERDLPTQAELQALLDEAYHGADGSPLGTVYAGSSDERRGVVVLDVAVADEAARQWAAERWGDRVELRGILRPVD